MAIPRPFQGQSMANRWPIDGPSMANPLPLHGNLITTPMQRPLNITFAESNRDYTRTQSRLGDGRV
eukprot:10527868-Lingulodinium_polyedra.AAC.1